MKHGFSLRRIVLAGSVLGSVAIATALIGLLLLLGTMRSNLAKNTETLISQQRAAEGILTEVYAQVLAAYTQIGSPDDAHISEFWKHGRLASRLIHAYLAAPLPRDARLQAERIKELHQQIEVQANQLFDRIRNGESSDARRNAEELRKYSGNLNAAVLEFLSIQSRQRNLIEMKQAETFRRLTILSALVTLLILVGGLGFATMLRRLIVIPLENLSAAAEDVGSGNLAARVPPQRAAEFSAVAASFNKMAEAIEHAQRNVRDRNARLEHALQELRDAQDDLVRQEKLSGLGQMLAGLAHELNNPMAGILGMSENLSIELAELRHPQAKELNDTLAAPLIEEAKRARDLVRNLLSFSRASEMSLGTANLSEAINVAVGLRGGAFRTGGKTLLVDVPADILVRGENQRLQQVFINLLNNALDAIGEGKGTALSITARVEPEDVEIVFQDDGPGFKAPSRVFDPFYTTKPAGMGTGLGLSLVLQFITEFGGTVIAENVASGGARVTIWLKRVTQAPPSDAQMDVPEKESSHASPLFAGMRFLIVDDELTLLTVQKRILLRNGAHVETAGSGTAAKEMLSAGQYDFVVSDIRMPGEADGLALVEWLAVQHPVMLSRVLLVTGDMSITNELLGRRLQPEQFLVKPFTVNEYLDRLVLLLSRTKSNLVA